MKPLAAPRYRPSASRLAAQAPQEPQDQQPATFKVVHRSRAGRRQHRRQDRPPGDEPGSQGLRPDDRRTAAQDRVGAVHPVRRRRRAAAPVPDYYSTNANAAGRTADHVRRRSGQHRHGPRPARHGAAIGRFIVDADARPTASALVAIPGAGPQIDFTAKHEIVRRRYCPSWSGRRRPSNQSTVSASPKRSTCNRGDERRWRTSSIASAHAPGAAETHGCAAADHAGRERGLPDARASARATRSSRCAHLVERLSAHAVAEDRGLPVGRIDPRSGHVGGLVAGSGRGARSGRALRPAARLVRRSTRRCRGDHQPFERPRAGEEGLGLLAGMTRGSLFADRRQPGYRVRAVGPRAVGLLPSSASSRSPAIATASRTRSRSTCPGARASRSARGASSPSIPPRAKTAEAVARGRRSAPRCWRRRSGSSCPPTRCATRRATSCGSWSPQRSIVRSTRTSRCRSPTCCSIRGETSCRARSNRTAQDPGPSGDEDPDVRRRGADQRSRACTRSSSRSWTGGQARQRRAHVPRAAGVGGSGTRDGSPDCRQHRDLGDGGLAPADRRRTSPRTRCTATSSSTPMSPEVLRLDVGRDRGRGERDRAARSTAGRRSFSRRRRTRRTGGPRRRRYRSRCCLPGEYVARAVISINGRKSGQVVRAFTIARAAMTTAAAGGNAKDALVGRAPIPFSSRIDAFDKSAVLTPQVVSFFLDRMNVGTNAPPPSIAPAIDDAKAGRFDAAVEALKSQGNDQLAVVFLNGLALYCQGAARSGAPRSFARRSASTPSSSRRSSTSGPATRRAAATARPSAPGRRRW